MPLPALHLRSFDSVAEFERAAAARYEDALLLHKRSHRTGAIYLFGYSVEMRVKALYFRNVGFTPAQAIAQADRDHARAQWQALGLPARPGQHDVSGWAQLAVAARAATARPAYGPLGQDIIDKARQVADVWSEILRYRAVTPLPKESSEVRTIARWFETGYDRMT